MLDLEQKKKDFQYGFKNELTIIRQLKNVFNNIEKNDDRYNHFDYRDDKFKIDIELKTRRIYKGQYNTIIFAECKLEEGRRKMKEGISERVIYCFNFDTKDKKSKELWYWEDDGVCEVDVGILGNYKRGDSGKRCIHIKCDDLKLFSKENLLE